MVKTIGTATIRSFVPEWEGNKDLSPGDQIKISHKAPSISLKEKLFPRKFEFTSNGEAHMSIEVDRRKLLKELVTRIDGLVIAVEGEEKKIATVEQLFDAGIELDTLVEEIYTYLNELMNGKVDEKN
jgi:hypothetical protein